MSVYTSLNNELCCPLCGWSNVHVNEVRVASEASGEGIEIGVNAAGRVLPVAGAVPHGTAVGPGRYHRIAMIGWCEDCDEQFAIVFTPHNGNTLAEAVQVKGLARIPMPRTAPRLDSEAERRFWSSHLAQALPALSGLVTQYEVGRYRLDFALPDQRFGIEIDGYAYHSDKRSFENDRVRQRDLERLGWRIVRYSGKEACSRPDTCVRDAADAAARFRSEALARGVPVPPSPDRRPVRLGHAMSDTVRDLRGQS